MNVTLPNGTTLTDIPDGTTQTQILEKLKANGMDTSWAEQDQGTPFEEQNVVARGVQGAYGALESAGRGATNFMSDYLLARPAGALTALAKREGVEEAVGYQKEYAEAMNITPKSKASEYLDEKAVGPVFEDTRKEAAFPKVPGPIGRFGEVVDQYLNKDEDPLSKGQMDVANLKQFGGEVAHDLTWGAMGVKPFAKKAFEKARSKVVEATEKLENAKKEAREAAEILEREKTFEPKREPGPGPVEFETGNKDFTVKPPVLTPERLAQRDAQTAQMGPKAPPVIPDTAQRGVQPDMRGVDPEFTYKGALEYPGAEPARAAPVGVARSIPEQGGPTQLTPRPYQSELVGTERVPKQEPAPLEQPVAEGTPERAKTEMEAAAKPAFMRTAEEKLQAEAWEASLREPPKPRTDRVIDMEPELEAEATEAEAKWTAHVDAFNARAMGGPGKKQGGAVNIASIIKELAQLGKLKIGNGTVGAAWRAGQENPTTMPGWVGGKNTPAAIAWKEGAKTSPLGGPGKKQGGAIGWKKGPSPYEKFKQEMESEGIKLPDHIARAIFDGKKAKEALAPRTDTTFNTAGPTLKHAETVPGLRTKLEGGWEDLEGLYANDWTLPELKEKITEHKKDIGWITTNTVRKIINGRFAAKTNPVTAYVSSKIHEFKQWAGTSADKLLLGELINEKGKRVAAPGSPMYNWNLLKEKQRAVINDTMQSFMNTKEARVTKEEINAKARELAGRDLTELEHKALQDRVTGMDKLIDDWNKHRAVRAEAIGRKVDPIPKLPNFWSPAEFAGRFIAFVKDPKTGEMLAQRGSYLKPDLKKLQAEFPNHTVNVVERGISTTVDLQHLESVIRMMAKPEGELVRNALGNAMRKQGALRHKEVRKGYQGYRGSQGGTKGMKDYEAVYEEYTREVYNHIANEKLGDMYNDIYGMKEARETMPNGWQFSLDAIDQARGRGNAGFAALDSGIGAVMNQMRLPQGAIKDVLNLGAQVKVKFLLAFGQTTQIMANLIQAPMYAPWKMLAIGAEQGGLGLGSNMAMVLRAGYKASKAYIKPSKADMADIAQLRLNGVLDATFKYDWERFNQGALLTNRAKAIDTLTGTKLLSDIESEIVRKPAALMFLHTLRESGYKGKDIYRIAGNLTDQYMVTNRRYEAAQVFGRTGLVGRALRPLQSFNTTWMGQMVEYLHMAKKNPTSASHVAPLAGFLASHIITSGLLGFLGFREWDRLAMTLNQLFPELNMPTGTESVLKAGKALGKYADYATFGALSTVTGYHYGSVFGAPSATGALAPGVAQLYDFANAVLTFGEEAATGRVSAVRKRDALKGVTPRMLWGWIEEHYTKPGMPYASKNSKGSVRRSEEDWTARKWGTYRIDEVKKKTANWEAKRLEKEGQGRRHHLLDKMAEELVQNGKIPPDLVKKAAALGYDGTTLTNSLIQNLIGRHQTLDQQLVGKGSSARQQQLWLLIQELQGGGPK